MPNKLPRDFFYAVIIFIMVITGGVALLNTIIAGEVNNAEMAIPGLMEGGGVSVDTFNDTLGQSDISAKVKEIEEKMKEVQPEEKSSNIFTLSGAFISTAWAAVDLVLSSLGIMTSTFKGLSSMFHVPIWAIATITLLVTVFFIFSILSLIFGKET